MGKNLLVVRRRVGEAVSIGGGIEIEIVEISRSRVKLGVKAPRSVPVVRKESIAAAAQNRRALSLSAGVPEHVITALKRLDKQTRNVAEKV